MREIKFRGKRIRNGKWIISSDIQQTNYSGIYLWSDGYWEEVIPETVGQYTGLTDKNGTEIYEGDIVKGKDNAEKSIEIFGYVDFTNGSFVVAGDLITHYRWVDYEVAVIGNIHDTPELLEAGE